MKNFLVIFVLFLSFSFNVFGQQPPKNYERLTHAIKVRPLSPLFGNYEVGYERGGLSGGNKALEVNVSYYSKSLLLGYLPGNERVVNGLGVRIGGKLYFANQEFRMAGMTRTHPMYGKYIKAELGFKSKVSRFTNSNGISQTENVNRIQLLFIGGKQFVADEFCFDIFGGLGYSYRIAGNPEVTSFKNNVPIGAELGFRMGYLFNPKKEK